MSLYTQGLNILQQDDLMAYVVGATIWHGLDGRREFDNVFADGEEAIHLPVPH